MNPRQPLRALDFAKLLAHEARWKLVTCLMHSDLRVQELVAQTAEAQNLVSYHLKHLREAGLVNERRSSADARDVYYSLNLRAMQQGYEALGSALQVGHAPHQAASSGAPRPYRVLFLCTFNSARSQMAEALLKAHGGLGIEVFSAGTEPATVHPLTLRVLQEMGLETRTLQSKAVASLNNQSFDYVITVCDRARESCPSFGGEVHLIHWSIPDPVAVTGNEATRYQAFRETALQISNRVRYFLAHLPFEEKPI